MNNLEETYVLKTCTKIEKLLSDIAGYNINLQNNLYQILLYEEYNKHIEDNIEELLTELGYFDIKYFTLKEFGDYTSKNKKKAKEIGILFDENLVLSKIVLADFNNLYTSKVNSYIEIINKRIINIILSSDFSDELKKI